jgi:hypothetical protein
VAVIAGAVAGIVVAVGAVAALMISRHRQRQRSMEQGMQSVVDVMPAGAAMADPMAPMAGQMGGAIVRV